ncbi:MAG: hypothetical protein IT389_10145 [Nitrospira sp.]|nr:hypothetical protein [Nitrospira sp.]
MASEEAMAKAFTPCNLHGRDTFTEIKNGFIREARPRGFSAARLLVTQHAAICIDRVAIEAMSMN